MRAIRSVVIAIAAGTALAACGGGDGGGGGSPPDFRVPPPTLVSDELPPGTRIDARSENFFPLGSGDRWTYDRVQSGATTPNAATREVTSGPDTGGNLLLTETLLGEADATAYRIVSEGLLLTDPMAGIAPPLARQTVGTVLEYPQPFYPIGAVRRAIRQGTWDADLDGDGRSEGFRFELSQVFLGFETLTLPVASLRTARFDTTVTFTITPSRLSNAPVTATSRELAWFAPGIGLVRSDRSASSAAPGLALTHYSLVLNGGAVGGQALFGPSPTGNLRTLALEHTGLVYDPTRNRFYASIPGSVLLNGNSIATIDPVTGTVSYSSAIGSEPGPLALAADGSTLYVGLQGTGQVIRLALPSMAPTGSATLPATSFFGQTFAETIAVSPADPNVVAVSMMWPGVSPKHAGVVLLRSMVLQPTMTRDHTGSNVIAFSASGSEVYGFNNETTEFGLRRLAVLNNGLAEQLVVASAGDFSIRSIDRIGDGLLLGNRIYGTPTLALRGTVSAATSRCRVINVPNRVVCLDSQFGEPEVRLAVADATTFVIQSRPVLTGTSFPDSQVDIVPGAAGQIALRDSGSSFGSAYTRLLLYTDPRLQ